MRGDPTRMGKRPLRALSASEKMEAIQRVHDGESKAAVARDIGVPESTLRGWCKSEHKIRGMARNSSTPDSEAHSPASSSGANPLTGLTGASNLSSEDEAVIGPSSAKKMKLDSLNACGYVNDNNGDNGDLVAKLDAAKQPKMDYMSSIINSLVGNVRTENPSMILQQLGLLSSAQNAASLKNLLGLTAGGLGAAAHLANTQTVGLVENGLQYTKSSSGLGGSSNNNHNKRSLGSSSQAHISAIAPTTQLDSVSKSGSRKSLPPAAEAPLTPVPASPRKTNSGDYQNGALNLHQQQNRPSKKDNNGSCGNNSLSSSNARKADEALLMWLAQQQAAAAAAPFNPSASGVDGSWFWQWYKQCSFPSMVPPMAMTTSSPTSAHQPLNSQSLPKKSPSKAKALLDNVLCNNNNNNENVRRSLNTTSSGSGNNSFSSHDDEGGNDEPTDLAVLSPEEAIEHGEKFFKWLDKCSDPSVTRLQIMQLKYLLDNLKSCRKKTTSSKRSRK